MHKPRISNLNQNERNNSSGFFNNFKLVLHRFVRMPLGLYSLSKRHGLSLRCSRTTGLSSTKESPAQKTFGSNFGTKVNSASRLKDYIGKGKMIRTTAIASSFALVLVMAAIFAPVYNNTDITEAATGTMVDSQLTLDVSRSTANVELTVIKDNGSFKASANPIAFDVSTNNYTGYTLSLTGDSATLTNGSYTLSSIDASISQSKFEENTAAAGINYNGKWGYNLKIGSGTVSNYMPAPDGGATTTLNTTSSANGTTAVLATAHPDSYEIGVGARASYVQAAGTYSGSFKLTAVSNAVNYSITYEDDSGDSSVKNIPDIQVSTTSANYITLASTLPTRNYYTFKAWCNGTTNAASTSCTGTEYAAGATFGIDQSTNNTTTLYAVWTPNKYDVAIRPTDGVSSVTLNGTSCSNANGCMVTNLNYGQAYTLTASLASGYSFSSWGNIGAGTVASASSDSTTFTVGGGSTVLTASATGTRSLTVTFENAGVTSVAVKEGSTTKGTATASNPTVSGLGANKTYTLVPTFANNYESATWQKTDSYGEIAYTVGGGNGAVTVKGNAKGPASMQEFTLANCQSLANGTNYTVADARDGNEYTVKYINGQCWMTQNLRFTGTTIKTTDTNINVDKTLSYNDLSASSNSSSSGPCYGNGSNGGNGYTNLCIKDSGDASKGVYYNYAAATAGTITGTSNSTAATYDICPKGWHLPTGPNTTANTDFNKLVGNTTSGWQAATTGLTAFGAVAAGSYGSGSLGNEGAYGYWWSASVNGAQYRYTLRYNSSNGQFSGSSYDNRYVGYSVRCVRTS